MKRTASWRIGFVLAVCLLVGARVHAILGLGDIVFDPTSFAKLTEQLLQMERQYSQLVQSYQMLRTQYEHAVRMSRQLPHDMRARYGFGITPWPALSAADHAGPVSDWVGALNTGTAALEAYNRGVEQLKTYPGGWSGIPDHARTVYGAVVLSDGANVNALRTIGQLRLAAPVTEAALERLQADTYSAAPELNTEIAVLNKINAADVANLAAARDTNSLLVTLAEQQVLAARRVRDAEARSLNQHVAFLADGQRHAATLAVGTTDALRQWRVR